MRLPRFGRAIGYHYPSADALVGTSGNEVYRLNLAQGRYLAPFELGQQGHTVNGVNAIDVNPAHGLLSFGTDGSGIVELWDPRMRQPAGSLNFATRTVMDAALLAARRQLPGVFGADAEAEAVAHASSSLTATALSSSTDGLNLAVGTNTGHVLLYDLRMDKPYTTKDQGFGLPIKSLSWPGDHNAAAGVDARARSDASGKVLSADAKVIKIWDRQSGDNLVSVSPSGPLTNLNDVQHYPGSGLLFAAVEATQMCAWYVPALGPAPRWCSFIDNVTDEIETTDATNSGGGVNAYEDFKFVDQAELERCVLFGKTNPSLELTHLIGTPLLRPYMHGFFISLRLYERARLLAHPTAYEEAKRRAVQTKLEREAESRVRNVKNSKVGRNVQVNRSLAEKVSRNGGESLLGDDRFKELFTNPEFQVDETSREFALLNPSSAQRSAPRDSERMLVPATQEEIESDRESLDPDQESDAEAESEPEPEPELESEQKSKPAPASTSAPVPKAAQSLHTPRVVDNFDAPDTTSDLTFEERKRQSRAKPTRTEDMVPTSTSISWTPSAASNDKPRPRRVKATPQETFGMGLSKGAGAEQGYGVEALDEEARFGRKQRRHPNRSASRNAMRAASR